MLLVKWLDFNFRDGSSIIIKVIHLMVKKSWDQRMLAVVTGDIVGFSRRCIDARRSFACCMDRICGILAGVYRGLIPGKPGVYRGDGWQVLLADPVFSLRFCLYVRAALKVVCAFDYDTKMAIGIGTVDYLPESHTVSAGDGEAFRLSGRLMDKIGADPARWLALDCHAKDLSVRLSSLVARIDEISRSWNQVDSRIFFRAVLSSSLFGSLDGALQAAASWEGTPWIKRPYYSGVSDGDKCELSRSCLDFAKAEILPWVDELSRLISVFEAEISAL